MHPRRVPPAPGATSVGSRVVPAVVVRDVVPEVVTVLAEQVRVDLLLQRRQLVHQRGTLRVVVLPGQVVPEDEIVRERLVLSAATMTATQNSTQTRSSIPTTLPVGCDRPTRSWPGRE